MDLMSYRLGTIELKPHTPAVAGAIGQWTLVYTVGSMGIDEGGTLKLSQRFASDWETPQFDQPQASGYTTVTTTGAAKLRAYYHTDLANAQKGFLWVKWTIVSSSRPMPRSFGRKTSLK